MDLLATVDENFAVFGRPLAHSHTQAIGFKIKGQLTSKQLNFTNLSTR